MANSLYTKALEHFLQGDIHWLTDDIKVVLVDTDDYTVDLATDEFLSAIPAGARTATSDNLSTKLSTDGIADADDVLYEAVSGDVSEAVVIYQDTGDPETSILIAYIDTATGLPVTPLGADVDILWNATGIFQL